jgi:hypothetical protein
LKVCSYYYYIGFYLLIIVFINIAGSGPFQTSTSISSLSSDTPHSLIDCDEVVMTVKEFGEAEHYQVICVSPEDDTVAEKRTSAKRKVVQNVVKKTLTFVPSSPIPESYKLSSRFRPDLLELLNNS